MRRENFSVTACHDETVSIKVRTKQDLCARANFALLTFMECNKRAGLSILYQTYEY